MSTLLASTSFMVSGGNIGVDVHTLNHTLMTMIPMIRTGIPLFSARLEQNRSRPSEFPMNDPRDHVILVTNTGEAGRTMASRKI